MKAIAIEEFGGPEKLKLIDLPMPEVASDEVLIKVMAAGVNPVDYKIREGYLKDLFPHEFPLIPGWDVAGVVEKVGDSVTRLSQGDEVYAYCRKEVVKAGAYAEYISLSADVVAHKPKVLSFEQAASVPLASLTAYQSLFDAAKIEEGETVLIHAAAGGVGGFAVQFAANAGAEVIGTASFKNHDYVRNMGASRVIDYTECDFRELIKDNYPDGIDVAFDCVGGEVLLKSADVLKEGGRLVSISKSPEEEAQLRSDINYHYVFVEPNAAQLEKIAKMVDGDLLGTHIACVLSLEDAAEAHDMMESRHTSGKVVLSLS